MVEPASGWPCRPLNNPYFVQLTDGARQAASELGVKLAVADAQNDAINQAVVHLRGSPGTSASRDRNQGFQQGQESGSIQVVATQPTDFDRAKGLDVMTNLLQLHPTLTGVFAENHEMALGAIKALGARAGKDVTWSVSMALRRHCQPSRRGNGRHHCPATQSSRRIAVEQAVKAAKGQPVQPVIDVEVKVVTRDNVAQFR